MARKTTYHFHSNEFKLTAVRLAELDDVQTKDVAESLDIHPFMLSRWKKDVRDGKIVNTGKQPKVDIESAAELKRLKDVERKFKRLQLEHEVLKKKIQYGLEQEAAASRLSKAKKARSQ